MPPILTGGHPLSGKARINAPAYTIVKWQLLYAVTDNGARAARLRQICGALPTVLFFRSSALSNGKGSALALFERWT